MASREQLAADLRTAMKIGAKGQAKEIYKELKAATRDSVRTAERTMRGQQ